MIQQNTIHLGDCLEVLRAMPDGCVDLIIADPPYFEVKGDFDFAWPSFEAYLADVDKWARECARVLADTGTLIWWGHALKIAYSQIVLDKYLTLLNSCVWEKKDCKTKASDPLILRRFSPVTERFLLYEKRDITTPTGLQKIYSNPDCFVSIKKYMRGERAAVMQHFGFTKMREFDEWINGVTGTASVASRHYFADSQWMLPTAEMWAKMQATGFFQREYEDLRKEYEDFRKEYEDLRRPFNLERMQTDVFTFSQEAHITQDYEHETKKPETLTRALILACSRKGDLVFVPFAGSGTECAMAAREGRRFIGCEIDPNHHRTASERVQRELSTPTLF